MHHKVRNAQILCIDTKVPHSDGACYVLPAGQVAIVSFRGRPDIRVEAGERERIFVVEHDGTIR